MGTTKGISTSPNTKIFSEKVLPLEVGEMIFIRSRLFTYKKFTSLRTAFYGFLRIKDLTSNYTILNVGSGDIKFKRIK